MIRKTILLGLMSFTLLFLPGCIQSDTVIKVKPDGSGFIEETFLMKKDFLRQLETMAENMAKQMGQSAAEKKDKAQPGKEALAKVQPPDFFNETKLKERAKELGEGVTYVSGSKVTVEDYEGFKAIYAFRDINKVKVKEDVNGKMPTDPGEKGADSEKKHGNITFSFIKGNPAELIIKLPADKVSTKAETPQNKEPAPADIQMPEEAKAWIMSMFKGMKMALSIDVDGSILRTNASYKKGSKVTLMEVDLGKLMDKPEQMQKFTQSHPETLEEMRELMKDFPGIKVELNNEVRIKFR